MALLLAGFLYIYKKKKKQKTPYLLFLLRFLSVLALLLLLINPIWEKNTLYTEKPKLVVAVDNSTSIKFVGGQEKVKEVLQNIKENTTLQEKFDIQYYSFGNEVRALDSLDFNAGQTNPTQLLQELTNLYNEDKTPVILLTDGNQTKGNSYTYFPSKNPIYPIVVGDTTHYNDLEITQLNANQYAFLDNQFPVEVFVTYNGSTPIQTQLAIYKGKQRVFTQKIQLSEDKKSENLSILLPADKVGQHYYSASLSALKNEKNTQNNRKDFSLEVVNQQTKVLLLTSFFHPDLGTIKKSIESNKQRKLTIKLINSKNINSSDYQLVILYQPNNNFNTIYKDILAKKINTILITGSKTDWNFLNKVQTDFSKKTSSQEENYQAVYNPNFTDFVTKNIDFESLSPLQDKFGKINFNVAYKTLLFQKIGNTQLDSPLLATYEREGSKNAILFGEGLWRWRMQSKIENQSFNRFDEFWNTIVQYTAKSKKSAQLHLEYEKLRYSNQNQVIKASYVDQNYKIDTKASIWLQLTNKKTKKTEKIPFALKGQEYQVHLPNLNPGTYNFSVSVAEKSIKKSGSFKVLDYNIEQQFTTANKLKLTQLAAKSGGKMAYVDNPNSLFDELAHSTNYKAIQKSKKTAKALIDWRWLLGFIILSLSAEWFIRKYKGLI